MISEWIPFLLIGIGAIIMVINIVRFFKLVQRLRQIGLKGQLSTKIMLGGYLALLICFLVGYIVVDATYFFPKYAINSQILIGLIFMLGSGFVLIGTALQLSLTQSIKRCNMEIANSLITAIEARDKNLNGHSIHVAALSGLIYNYLSKNYKKKLNPATLEYAALLHDIGKLGISLTILEKDSALTDEEWEIIKEHPRIGKNILSSMESFQDIADWVFYHHERCDGKGYYSLPYEKIPLPSQIIAVADTFSALTMTRSYRKSKSYEEAVEVLKSCRGTQLNSVLVDIFLSIPEEEVKKQYHNIALEKNVTV